MSRVTDYLRRNGGECATGALVGALADSLLSFIISIAIVIVANRLIWRDGVRVGSLSK